MSVTDSGIEQAARGPMTPLAKLLGDLKAVRAHHAFTRDNIGQPGCEVRKVASAYVKVLDRAVEAIETFPAIRAETIEECAKAAEAFDDPDRDWLRRSVWDEIKQDTAKRIRALRDVAVMQ